MPANEIAKLFAEEWQAPHQQFDLVLFLDGDEGGKRAQASDVAAFQESWKRPKWHIVSREFSEGVPAFINRNPSVKP